jgi:putative cardiolipin synthase
VRRFNPGRVRSGILSRSLQMMSQFRALNRRMHNKQLIVDGQWGIIGGRNMGNPYFGLSKEYNNRDLDVLITGPILKDMAEDFDEYWNAEATYPGEAMYGKISDAKVAKGRKRFDEMVAKDAVLLGEAGVPVERHDWSEALSKLPGRMWPGTAETLKDAPIVQGDRGTRLIDLLRDQAPQAAQRSCIISPYMIPSKEQLERLAEAVEKDGLTVRILVPSMESNNHTMAHSHYKKYRKRLLKAGVDLYEFRGQPSDEVRAKSNTKPIEAKFISLHTKAFVLDDRWVMLGSLNLDPRSIKINTEHMLLVDSPKLAEKLQAQFDIMTASENAWHVTLNKKGKLRWQSGDEIRKRQPARGTMQRVSDFFYRWLPIEGQL